jgi:hypothetical protein
MNFYDGGNDSAKTLAVKRGVIEWFWNNARSRRITPEANYHGWVVDVLAYVDRGRWAGTHVVEAKVTKSDFRKDMSSPEDLQAWVRDWFAMRGAIEGLRCSAEREARIRVGGCDYRWTPRNFRSRRVTSPNLRDERRAWRSDEQYQCASRQYDRARRWLDRMRRPKLKFLSPCFTQHTDFCWIAGPPGLIEADELPPGFGLFRVNATGGTQKTRVHVWPTRIEPVAETADYALAEISRRNTQLLLKQANANFGPGAMRIPREDTCVLE